MHIAFLGNTTSLEARGAPQLLHTTARTPDLEDLLARPCVFLFIIRKLNNKSALRVDTSRQYWTILDQNRPLNNQAKCSDEGFFFSIQNKPINNKLLWARKYARIIVRGYCLFREANSLLEGNCEPQLRGTDNVQGQLSHMSNTTARIDS